MNRGDDWKRRQKSWLDEAVQLLPGKKHHRQFTQRVFYALDWERRKKATLELAGNKACATQNHIGTWHQGTYQFRIHSAIGAVLKLVAARFRSAEREI